MTTNSNYNVTHLMYDRVQTQRVEAFAFHIDNHGVLVFTANNGRSILAFREWMRVEESRI